MSPVPPTSRLSFVFQSPAGRGAVLLVRKCSQAAGHCHKPEGSAAVDTWALGDPDR